MGLDSILGDNSAYIMGYEYQIMNIVFERIFNLLRITLIFQHVLMPADFNLGWILYFLDVKIGSEVHFIHLFVVVFVV